MNHLLVLQSRPTPQIVGSMPWSGQRISASPLWSPEVSLETSAARFLAFLEWWKNLTGLKRTIPIAHPVQSNLPTSTAQLPAFASMISLVSSRLSRESPSCDQGLAVLACPMLLPCCLRSHRRSVVPWLCRWTQIRAGPVQGCFGAPYFEVGVGHTSCVHAS